MVTPLKKRNETLKTLKITQTSLENTALEINNNLGGFINKVKESRQVHFLFNIIRNLCIDQL